MEKQELKQLVLSKLSELEKQWTDAVNKEERVTAADYLRVGNLEGGINALLQLLVEIEKTD
ncbi:MAG: hypothetical protein ACK54F_03410 [Planctomycetia bacterium]|jgi:hypothetical protein